MSKRYIDVFQNWSGYRRQAEFPEKKNVLSRTSPKRNLSRCQSACSYPSGNTLSFLRYSLLDRTAMGVCDAPLRTEQRPFSFISPHSLYLNLKRCVYIEVNSRKFNFVGKLLGPKGNSLKRLQEETMTKMAILGRGSMRDKQKEEELRGSNDPKFSHLSDDLHVEVTAFAPPAEAHARIAYALAEIRKFLVPDYNDEIRQEQMREIQLMNAGAAGAVVGAPANPEAAAAAGLAGAAAAAAAAAGAAGKVVSPRCPQPAPGMILHPALRELSRAPGLIPAATMFRGASILSRVRAPTLALAGQRGAASPASKRSILTLLGRVGRPTPGEDGGLETGDDSGAAAAAAAAAALRARCILHGYGLLEDYTNGSGLSEDIEDMSQDSVNGAAGVLFHWLRVNSGADVIVKASELALWGLRRVRNDAHPNPNPHLLQRELGAPCWLAFLCSLMSVLVHYALVAAAEFAARPEGGALKVSTAADRARYRHDPYGRYPAKLQL
ncbi:hypothetical protein B566_EDAN006469 [Ephemera danica]|nr:hypothetical protein B566_EDAN006469 [Ephemera danica]